jgi:hypothetical protein
MTILVLVVLGVCKDDRAQLFGALVLGLLEREPAMAPVHLVNEDPRLVLVDGGADLS